MSDAAINYNQSAIPPAKPGAPPAERIPDREIKTDDAGNLRYDSAAASGMVQVFLPGLPGDSHGEERLLAKDFGAFIATKIESSFKRQPYLRSGPTQNPAATFRHYVACAAGSGLVDSAVLSHMKMLSKEFEQEAEPEEFFREVLAPYLHSLAPKRRS